MNYPRTKNTLEFLLHLPWAKKIIASPGYEIAKIQQDANIYSNTDSFWRSVQKALATFAARPVSYPIMLPWLHSNEQTISFVCAFTGNKTLPHSLSDVL